MIKWQAPEFEYFKKSDWWYWSLIVASVILGLVALWQKNFLFLIFIVIAAVIIALLAKEQPKSIDFSLDNKGLWVGNKLFHYQTFHSFAIKDGLLQMSNKGRFRPHLTIPLPEDQQEEIKKHLLAFLPKVEYNESTIDALSKILRF